MNKKILTIIIVLIICAIFLAVGFFLQKYLKITNEQINIYTNYDESDLNSDFSGVGNASITLSDEEIIVNGTGVSVNKNVATIVSSGIYTITGEMSDGQIIVKAPDTSEIKIILNNVNLTCKTSAPIYVESADKVIINLLDGTTNYITDGENYIYSSNDITEPDGAIFSKDDLTINGNGTLNISANYLDGIVCKDDLKIVSGNINIKAVDDGIRGTESVSIKDGTISIDSTGDGIVSTKTDDEEKGYILIEGGKISISTGGGSNNSSTSNSSWGMWGKENNNNSSDTKSSKAIKATNIISINGGDISIDSSDDSIHSNKNVIITGGEIKVTSGDDGIHADETVTINGGNITISKSYEGIEGTNINISDGIIYITSSDDGFNINGGVDNSAMNGRPGQNMFNTTSNTNNKLIISGGYIYVDSTGDGLDSNGSIEVSGGTIIVNGPTNNGNGTLDYDSTFNMSGGTLIAAGSSGMLQTTSQSSTQCSIAYVFSSGQKAGSLISLQDENGNAIVTFAPSKTYQAIVICTKELQKGSSYKLYFGGSDNGESKDGIYTGGTYSSNNFITFNISNVVTTLGNSNFNMENNMRR